VEDEVARLCTVEFFEYEQHSVERWKLCVTGVLRYQRKYGGTESLRVRLEYGPKFPDVEPVVFDHERVFRPSVAGHQFSNYSLCLRFPYRKEFSTDAAVLGREVLGAAFNWMIKRNIFERTGAWPGETEEHGQVKPFIVLVREQACKSGNRYLTMWVDVALEFKLLPQLSAACPCQSGRQLESCHVDLGLLLARAIFAQDLENRKSPG
jgi:hypothetical protein